ncbi:MAG TPA: thiamine phosphate synthase [Candidatus Dormibacteraeota bacterium]|nr:thiamine phosphate synthase [Candidatus Dormibacteraeota bacterium]
MAIVPDAAAGLRTGSRATILQLRAPHLTTRELEREAAALVASSPVPVVVSSRCDVAVATGAAGVNLPERDIGVEFARGLIRRGLVGRSVHSLEAAKRAGVEGADYVIFGPVWRSASHPDVKPVGVEALSSVAAAVRIPVLAIGGVSEERVDEVHAAGAAGYAAIGMFSWD